MDKHRTIEKIIISYYNRNNHLKVLLEDKKMGEEQREDSIIEIKKQMKGMLNDIRIIDPNFDITYLENNIDLVYNRIKEGWMEISKNIGNTVKKAYYDFVQESLQKGDSKPTYKLLLEICQREN